MPRSYYSPEVVRRNFRIDLFGGISAGIYASVLVAFMPVVVRRMGGSTFDVALVVAGPFIGHLLSPIGIYLLSSFPAARAVAGSSFLSRVVFISGVLVATTPLMLALTTISFWIVTIANIAAYTTVMAAIYPGSERASAMGKVRIGSAVASIAAAAVAGVAIDEVPATLVFAAAAIVSVPGTLGFFWLRDEGRARESAATRPGLHVIRDVWNDRPYSRLLFANTVFGLGNLMNGTIVPLMLVDHFAAPNTFIGAMAALASATSIGAYLIWGRLIDRGSSLRFSAYNVLLVLLIPMSYLLAPTMWFLLPAAIVTGVVNAGFDITFHTNIVQAAPRGRVLDYATAQSFILGVRGTIAPFMASALLAVLEPRMVLLVVIALMTAGVILYFRAVRAYETGAIVVPLPEPAPAS